MTRANTYSRWILPALIAFAALLFIGTAGGSPLVDDDIDAAHALVAREMLQRHDYVVMYMDGLRYLIRPPLHFWLVAASYSLLGESAFATRLPLALCMVGLAIVTFAFGRRFFAERAGCYAALATVTSAGMFIFTRNVIPEAIYALEFTALFYLFLRSWTGSLDPRIGYWGAAVLCALAMLTRGLIGVLFPLGALIGFITLTRSWHRWRELRLFSSTAIFLIVAAPWHILAGRRAPGFYWAFFVNEHINRALGTRLPHDYGAVPLWLWWLELSAWLFPWSLFAVLLLREFPSPRTWRQPGELSAQVRLFLFIWVGVILLFFSVEGGSRMEYYSFGAWPALCLLLGVAIARAEANEDPRLLRIARLMALIGVLFASIAAYFVWAASHLAGVGTVSNDVVTHGTDFYRSAMAHVLDLTPKALAELRVPIATAAGSLFAALMAAWLLRRRRKHFTATIALALGMSGFFLAAYMANKELAVSLSSYSLALELNKTLLPTDQIALYGDIRVAPGIAFYSHRRVLLYNATGSNLEFGSHYADAPKTFFTDEDFLPLWKGDSRVFLVVPVGKVDEVRHKLPVDATWVFAAGAEKKIYMNRPPALPPKT